MPAAVPDFERGALWKRGMGKQRTALEPAIADLYSEWGALRVR